MKVLIVEDEKLAANRLQKMLMQIDEDIQVVDRLESIEQVIKWWKNNAPPDLIFMDIHLADGSAFEIYKQITIVQPVIFTTAYDQYAIQSFEVNVLDYLLKPIKKDRLTSSIEKYKLIKKDPVEIKQTTDQLNQKQAQIQRFLIRNRQNIKVVELGEVSFFYTQNKLTFLVATDAKRHTINYTIERLEKELDSRTFFRVNRQFIVRVSAIERMERVSKSRVRLFLKPLNIETIVSTERSGKFKKWLTGKS